MPKIGPEHSQPDPMSSIKLWFPKQKIHTGSALLYKLIERERWHVQSDSQWNPLLGSALTKQFL